MEFELQVKGLDELRAKLRQIAGPVAKRVTRRGLSRAAQAAKQAASEAAPYRTGVLRRAAIVKFAKEWSSDTHSAYLVTFRRGRKAQSKRTKRGRMTVNRDAYYAAWVEFGHNIVARFRGRHTDYKLRGRGRLTGLSARRRAPIGFVQGRHYLENSFKANKEHYLAVIVRQMSESLEQEARK